MSKSDKNWQNSLQHEPGNINPEETGFVEPSKRISEIEKLDIKESEHGRDVSQNPADEPIGDSFSQIDEETREIQTKKSMEQTMKKEFDTDDFNRVDERDVNDSTTDWDAEKSRTGRHK